MQSQHNREIELEPQHNNHPQSNPDQQHHNQQKTKILFEKCLPSEYPRGNLPIELIKKRNLTIKALFIQIFAAVAGLGFYFFRRLRIYLIVNTFSLLFVAIGFKGTLSLHKWKIAAHSVATMSILGSFWAYFVLEVLFFQRVKSATEETRSSERMTIFLFAVPYLIDLICGMISFALTYSLFQLEESKERLLKNAEMHQEFIEANENYDPTSKNCCVCLNFQKNCVIYPCGHLALCNYCSKQFKERNIRKCPLCNANIQDIIQTYS